MIDWFLRCLLVIFDLIWLWLFCALGNSTLLYWKVVNWISYPSMSCFETGTGSSKTKKASVTEFSSAFDHNLVIPSLLLKKLMAFKEREAPEVDHGLSLFDIIRLTRKLRTKPANEEAKRHFHQKLWLWSMICQFLASKSMPPCHVMPPKKWRNSLEPWTVTQLWRKSDRKPCLMA